MVYSKENVFETFIEVEVKDNDSFLIIRETLTRIGIADRQNKVLFQPCFLFHKRGMYYIVHYKQIQALNGKTVQISDAEFGRARWAANVLANWGLTKIISNSSGLTESMAVVQSKDKPEWTLRPLYIFGK